MRIFDFSLFRSEFYALSIPEFIAIYRELLQKRKNRGGEKMRGGHRQDRQTGSNKSINQQTKKHKIPTPKPDLKEALTIQFPNVWLLFIPKIFTSSLV